MTREEGYYWIVSKHIDGGRAPVIAFWLPKHSEFFVDTDEYAPTDEEVTVLSDRLIPPPWPNKGEPT
jgi:hypothetical protein